MIRFKKITGQNFAAVLDMKQAAGQQFVPPNAESLAQAWMYAENPDVYAPVHSFAIYDGDIPVGFMQLYDEAEKRSMFLWRVMIAAEHQGKGLGIAAVRQIIALTRESGRYSQMELGCKAENTGALHIYEKLGFRPAGEAEEGELPMRLTF